MRDYSVVHTTFWTSPTVQDLSDDGRMLALYLLTGPHSNALGCFRLASEYVQADLHWQPERVSKGFTELFRNGFATVCQTTKWVLIKAYLKWNRPENPNQAKNLRRLANQVPENASIRNDLKAAIDAHCSNFGQLEIWPENETLSKPLPKPFRNGLPNQEQEQEQDKEQKTVSSPYEKNGSLAVSITLTLNTGKQYPITQHQSQEWERLFPAVDVAQELRGMRAWLDANPKNRKTKNGILRFCARWLSKAQNQAPRQSSQQPSPIQPEKERGWSDLSETERRAMVRYFLRQKREIPEHMAAYIAAHGGERSEFFANERK